jgi:hypothetical protein
MKLINVPKMVAMFSQTAGDHHELLTPGGLATSRAHVACSRNENLLIHFQGGFLLQQVSYDSRV